MKITYYKKYDGRKFITLYNSNGKAIFQIIVRKISIVFIYYRNPCNIVFVLGGKNEKVPSNVRKPHENHFAFYYFLFFNWYFSKFMCILVTDKRS